MPTAMPRQEPHTLSPSDRAGFMEACKSHPVLARDFAVSIAIAEGRIAEGDVPAAMKVAVEAVAACDAVDYATALEAYRAFRAERVQGSAKVAA